MTSCRAAALLAAAWLRAEAADLKIDHATIAGLDLRQLQADFASAGLPSEYGGKHANRATEMAIVSFADGSYLELISKQAGADPKNFAEHPWAKFISDNGGPCAWAVRSSNVAAEVKRLRSAGVPASDLARSGRDRPDGVHLDWETANVGSEGHGMWFPFLIRDLTPRQNRAYPSGKANAPQFSGISKVVIAAPKLDEAIERYRKAYSLGDPRRQTDRAFGADLAIFEGTPVVLASPLERNNWIAARLTKYGASPCAFLIARAGATAGAQAGRTPHGGWPAVTWLKLKSVDGRVGLEAAQ